MCVFLRQRFLFSLKNFLFFYFGFFILFFFFFGIMVEFLNDGGVVVNLGVVLKCLWNDFFFCFILENFWEEMWIIEIYWIVFVGVFFFWEIWKMQIDFFLCVVWVVFWCLFSISIALYFIEINLHLNYNHSTQITPSIKNKINLLIKILIFPFFFKLIIFI